MVTVKCQICGCEVATQKTTRKYCSPHCMALGHRAAHAHEGLAMSPADALRFWAKVRPSNGCWEWTSSKNIWGYGLFWLNGKYVTATHIALKLDGVDVPTGMKACHTCDNPGCVRRSHLFVGTQAENQQDAIRKGRRSHVPPPPAMRGSRHPMAKLTEGQVTQIRDLLAQGHVPEQLAMRYTVSTSTINNIGARRSWSWLQ